MTRIELHAADDSVGMTLPEAESLLRQAKQAGATGECVLMGRIGWSNKVKSLAIETDPNRQPGAKRKARQQERQRKRATQVQGAKLPPGFARL